VQCIYFGPGEKCYANPPIPALAGKYKPDASIRNKYCKTDKFGTCPRFLATINVRKASKGQ